MMSLFKPNGTLVAPPAEFKTFHVPALGVKYASGRLFRRWNGHNQIGDNPCDTSCGRCNWRSRRPRRLRER
ncbi:MAG TPA: hypothetical protein VGC97_17250 [Pyrinomonadaceae bacterium]